jgi:hypothetical protein
LLHVIQLRSGHIIADIHDVGTVVAHALGAIIITVLRVALTGSGLGFVPVAVDEGGGVSAVGVRGRVIEGDSLEGKVLNVLALAVTTAIIRASSTLASLSFKSGKALALTAITVANTSRRALRILVMGADLGWLINPGKVIGANALRAVTGVMAEAEAPVIITVALGVEVAHAMAGTRVVALRLRRGEDY